MKTLKKIKHVTLTTIAGVAGITQGTLSNYILANRKINLRTAIQLQSITGIDKTLWIKVSHGKKDPYSLRKKLGMAGFLSVRRSANITLSKNFNKYITQKAISKRASDRKPNKGNLIDFFA